MVAEDRKHGERARIEVQDRSRFPQCMVYVTSTKVVQVAKHVVAERSVATKRSPSAAHAPASNSFARSSLVLQQTPRRHRDIAFVLSIHHLMQDSDRAAKRLSHVELDHQMNPGVQSLYRKPAQVPNA